MLKISKEANTNYLAKIVYLKEFKKHPNADRLKMVTIDFQDVITGINAEEGLYVFFPLECQINYEFLKDTNSFSSALLNADTTEKGYLEKKGRVRATKLRGEKSMGYIVPWETVREWAFRQGEEVLTVSEGTEFDMIGDIKMCQKYEVPVKHTPGEKLGKKPRISRLVDGQVHLHVSTENLRKEHYKIKPEDRISVSYKVHGTSWWVSNVLVKKISLLDKILNMCHINRNEHDIVYGSRKVVKNEFETKNKSHFYGYDLWSSIAEDLKAIPKGYTVYGEAVGFTKGGSYIQKDYDYGCIPPNMKLQVYRVTHTNPDGLVTELSTEQIIEFCGKLGLDTVHYFYVGEAGKMYDDFGNFIPNLERDYNDKDCFMCNNEVPEEGIVVRKEKLFGFEAYKLKSFKFLERESKMLDQGEEDIESNN